MAEEDAAWRTRRAPGGPPVAPLYTHADVASIWRASVAWQSYGKSHRPGAPSCA